MLELLLLHEGELPGQDGIGVHRQAAQSHDERRMNLKRKQESNLMICGEAWSYWE